MVLDIVPQVPRRRRPAAPGRPGSIRAAIVVGMRDARVARAPAARRRPSASERAGPAGPARRRRTAGRSARVHASPRSIFSHARRRLVDPGSSALSPMMSAASHRASIARRSGPARLERPARCRTAARTARATSATDVRELVSSAIDRTSRIGSRRVHRHRGDRPARRDRQIRHDAVAGPAAAQILDRRNQPEVDRARRAAARRSATARRSAARTAASRSSPYTSGRAFR